MTEEASSLVDPNVRQVVEVAKQELQQLIEQRSFISRRIATTKQTILGLAEVFGDHALRQELLEFLNGSGHCGGRQPGFTRTCRLILMEANGPMDTRTLCQQLWLHHRDIASRHKDLAASVTTVLNRLVKYGEVRAIDIDGKRAWQWASCEEPSQTSC